MPGHGLRVLINRTTENFLNIFSNILTYANSSILRHDFVLVSGDVVTNLRLPDAAERHRRTCAADPHAAITLVYKKCAPGHPTRTALREMVVAAAAGGRVVFHQRGADASRQGVPIVFKSC